MNAESKETVWRIHCRMNTGLIRIWKGGFTVIELLVVIATITLLVSIMIPVLGRGIGAARSLTCMNNMRQLALSWVLYSHEHNGQLPPNQSDWIEPQEDRKWVLGLMKLGEFDGHDETNKVYLRQSILSPYLNEETKVFRCPSDPSTAHINGRKHLRVRSVSMNGYLGSRVYQGKGFRVAFKYNQIFNPSPSETFVFVEERADTIDNGFFAVGWKGLRKSNGKGTRWVEIPANYHNQSSSFGFADGHAERKQWERPMPDMGVYWNNHGFRVDSYNPDCLWLYEHATLPRGNE